MKSSKSAVCSWAAIAVIAGALTVTNPAAAQDSFGPTPPDLPQPQASPDRFEPPAALEQPAAPSGSNFDALMQIEQQDYGVPPTAALHAGQMHAPTPASIPGGQVITTKGLAELLGGRQVPVLLLDVLGGPEIIQGAQYAVPASQPGSFNDRTQQEFGQFLAQATGGNREHPVVLYCLSTQCWLSYNAALRAINLGYTNVLWYRGGIEAWKQAGLPTQRVQ